jgi:hypothetical protein
MTTVWHPTSTYLKSASTWSGRRVSVINDLVLIRILISNFLFGGVLVSWNVGIASNSVAKVAEAACRAVENFDQSLLQKSCARRLMRVLFVDVNSAAIEQMKQAFASSSCCVRISAVAITQIPPTMVGVIVLYLSRAVDWLQPPTSHWRGRKTSRKKQGWDTVYNYNSWHVGNCLFR